MNSLAQENFLNRTPLVQELKSTNNKWDLMKQKSLFMAKDTITGTKKQHTEWERFYQLHIRYTADIQNTEITKK